MSANRHASTLPFLAVATVIAAIVGLAACGSSSDPAPPPPTAGCAAYCTTLTANCSPANAQFADEAACNTYCTRALTDPDFWSAGTAGATSGNSLACRTTHAGLAPTNAAVHCPHAGPTGASVCGDLCENYCDLAASLCTGANQITFSGAGCLADCALFAATGANNATSGDTVQCRINHFGLIVSGGPPATHCGHARPVPTGACI